VAWLEALARWLKITQVCRAKEGLPGRTIKKLNGKSMQNTLSALALATAALLAAPFAQAQELKGNADAAKAKMEMCAGCHSIPGYRMAFPETYHAPKIAGQSEKFIYNSLQAYKKGDREHPTMRAIAMQLTDQDMADLATYYATRNK
jgi:cytochrome c553